MRKRKSENNQFRALSKHRERSRHLKTRKKPRNLRRVEQETEIAFGFRTFWSVKTRESKKKVTWSLHKSLMEARRTDFFTFLEFQWRLSTSCPPPPLLHVHHLFTSFNFEIRVTHCLSHLIRDNAEFQLRRYAMRFFRVEQAKDVPFELNRNLRKCRKSNQGLTNSKSI